MKPLSYAGAPRTSGMPILWTDAMLTDVRHWWMVDGLSAQQIADRLGVSRSSAISQIRRMGLTGRKHRSHAQILDAERRRKPDAVPPAPKVHADVIRLPPVRAAVDIVLPDEPVPRRLHLFDLKDRDCRWPFGNKPYTFCGHPREPGSSYCAFHAEASRNPGSQRDFDRIANACMGQGR